MRIDPPRGLLHALADGLVSTLRYRVAGWAHVAAAARASPTRSVIFCMFHQQQYLLLGRHRRQRVAILASLSRDGSLIADYLEHIGLRPVRGSSSRGGLRAARELIHAIEEGWHAAVTVDGPRGPSKEVKPGALEIARLSGAPLVPVAAWASLRWQARSSWDQGLIPLPCARVGLAYGPAIHLPPELPDPVAMLARRRSLAGALYRLEAQAACSVGHAPPASTPQERGWMRGHGPAGGD